MVGWEGRRAFLLEEARDDLERGEDVRPRLVAWRGENPLLVAYLRAFRRGGHIDALVEVLSVAVPLGADRLAMSVGGRAWSLRDPVPPVIEGVGDLRQRVVCVEQVDGSSRRTVMETMAVPYTLDGGRRVTWLPPVDAEDTISRVATALAAALHHRARFAAPIERVRERAVSCVEVGHLVAFSMAAHGQLSLHETNSDDREPPP